MEKTEKKEIRRSGSIAYALILEQILNFTRKPGEVITEVSLSEQFGISRTPVREAISRLENEGLIITENRTKKIYYLTSADIENIFDLKIAIESSIAGKAAVSGNKEDRDSLSNILILFNELISDKTSGKKDEDTFFKEWLEADKCFHKLLFNMAGNQRAEQFVNILNIQWHRIKMGLLAIEGRVEKAEVEHAIIGNAVISGNRQQGEDAVRDHLTNLKSELIKLMKTFNY